MFSTRRLVSAGWLAAGWLLLACIPSPADQVAPTNTLAWLDKPLSLEDCLNLSLVQNSTIQISQQELEAVYGVVVQTRAIVIPKVRARSSYQKMDEQAIERIPVPFPITIPDQNWSANVQIVQSIFEGGRMRSALRSARLMKDQALFNHQAVVADTLLEVRVAYDQVLLAEQQILVQEASVKLLTQELEDTSRRYEAGTVPRFNVLRAEVERANARPRLIKAKNACRIAKNNLAHLLGYRLPKETWEDLPMQLSGKLEAVPYDVALPVALAQALERRPELGALRKAESLRQEAIAAARGGAKPSIQVFTGYGSRNSSYSRDMSMDISGWFAGGQLSWDIFDGLLTQGKVDEAKARYRQAQIAVDDTTRRIELEVRTAYSYYSEAKEVLESQKKVVEQAEEALRLATARSEAGTGTQLDVLGAQTSLTEARTTQIVALHDYSVARARLERAIGQNLIPSTSVK